MRIVFFYCLLLIGGMLYGNNMQAQEIEPIQTDRPDQTESPFITPTGQLQMEFGFVYEKEKPVIHNYTYPNILSKIGITKQLELRLVTEYAGSLQNESSAFHSDTQYHLFNPTLIGCKMNLLEEKNLLPQTSLILHIGLPFIAHKSYHNHTIFSTFRFLMQHTISEKISLSYNLGAEWDGLSPKATGIYTLALGYSISKHFGSYIELYGFAPQHESVVHQSDMGFTYLITPDIQLDISGGLGITTNAPNYFVGCGFSFRTGH